MEQTYVLSHGELKIPVILTEPEDGDIRRIVLGVHGMGGSARDDIQSSIAEEMDMFYSATVRFDFPAHGESPMSDAYLDLQNCLDCLNTVSQWVRDRYPQVEDLCVFATGFGAYITLLALQDLQELPGKVKLVVQTPNVMMHNALVMMSKVSRETFWAMERVTLKAKRPFDITYRFYEELRDHPIMTTYPVPMLIVVGENDVVINMTDIQNFRRLNEKSKLVIIPGASHRFLEEGAWDMVLDLTRDWFEFEQVLLTDWI